ncbi:VOC family protein [Cellulomonas sp. URHE0023]|uniref:VOC family protein n=1 Tax=Cellulomonas sp. URHE0023 TaxID=1380354 RepID=UPI00054D2A73|nr:VOC family protein [Cellulomonas sp. URHE0023]
MPPVISQLVIDSAEPHTLAAWWREVLDWIYAWEPEDDGVEVEIAPPDGSAANLLFLRVSEVKVAKNRLHIDLRPPNGSSQAAELERLLSLGARPIDIGQGDVTWHVLADPEGNEFCLLKGTPAEVAAHMAQQAAG